MELLNLVQGTDEWLAARLSHFTASEAPIMMGASSHMSRDDLLKYKTTTIQEEVSYFTQLIFDKGHKLEEMARPIAEKILHEELYPVTGKLEVEGLPLLASFDGLDLMEEAGFEHKQWNEEKAKKLDSSQKIQPEHFWQLEQQLLVSGAEMILFMMSDGTEVNNVYLKYASVPERRAELIAGWKQFQKDLDGYTPVEYTPAPEANAIMELPSLSIQLVGEVKGSNLAVYKTTALAFIESISTELTTDQHFADADKTIKFCDKAEKELELVKKQALSQTADIDLLFRTVDELKEAMRSKRLELTKLVKAEKEAIKSKIVMASQQALTAHIAAINVKLAVVVLPLISADFNKAIKGKKTVKSLQESANDELAAAKIKADTFAVLMSANLLKLTELASEHKFLFNDLQQIILKENDDFKMLVEWRINDHKETEEKKLEAQREKIRLEEEAKATLAAEHKVKCDGLIQAWTDVQGKSMANADADEAFNMVTWIKGCTCDAQFFGDRYEEAISVYNDCYSVIIKKHSELVKAKEVDAETNKAAEVEEQQAIAEVAHDSISDNTENLPEPIKSSPSLVKSPVNEATEVVEAMGANQDEKDMVQYLYSDHGLYGQQATKLAQALIAGRVPHVSYNLQNAKAA